MIRLNSGDLMKFKSLLKESNKIHLASHLRPDGDSLGSLLGLAKALKNEGKDVSVIKVDEIPDKYKFLPCIDYIKEYDEDIVTDLFISLDCGDLDRLGYAKKIARNANNLVNIDHHKTNTRFGDINFVFDGASSTGEIVYNLIRDLDIELDIEIAELLYTAISTDTGSFMYSSTTAATHEVTADLMRTNFNFESLIVNLYQNREITEIDVFKDSLNTLEYFFENRVSIISVPKSIILDNKASWTDTDGLVEFARDIKGVEIACLLQEYDEDYIKISLRSKESVDVSELASKFNGGGHKRAAGCSIEDSLGNAKDRLLNEIEKYI